MNKLGAYQLLSLEEANMVDRYLVGMERAEQQQRLANLVLELRAERPPLTTGALRASIPSFSGREVRKTPYKRSSITDL
jgi:hypothetical protein